MSPGEKLYWQGYGEVIVRSVGPATARVQFPGTTSETDVPLAELRRSRA